VLRQVPFFVLRLPKLNMRSLRIDKSQEIPLVYVLATGIRGTRRLRLVFDTGCGVTQIDSSLIENLGYSAATDEIERVIVRGPAGDPHEGYTLKITALDVLEKSFNNPIVAAYDFENFAQYGIHGLLGWDLIKQLHLELDGPNELLKIL